VRVDPPGGSIVPIPLEFEWQVYELLNRTEIPVAKAYWFDAAPEVSGGRPLFVRAMVDGVTYPPGLQADTAEAAERRKRVALEYVEKMALVHRLDWKAHGFDRIMPAPASPESAPREELMQWWAIWDEVKTEPFPIITEVLHWFLEHLPKRAAAVTLCKGQTGIGEEIWVDDKIVALSDWELAHIGDPIQDLALSQGMLKLWDRDRILAHYEAHAGFSLPVENIAYYSVWQMFSSLLTLNAGLRAFLKGKNRRLARATLGLGKVKVYEHLMGGILDMDVEAAAEHCFKSRPNPYHDKKVSGG
ncbi:MAG TPA: phosphotransferase family protein, partial [Stellaceae bacterium]|nr:phosphotransferase family protein [Stellaceae bacterium]